MGEMYNDYDSPFDNRMIMYPTEATTQQHFETRSKLPQARTD